MDLVKAGKDVILLRTFSKIYGMAGLRCGAVFGRPDLLEKIENYGGWNFMPITALVAASASLKDAQLVPERKRINARIRGEVFAWLDRNGYSYIPSESNCFMLDTKRPAKPAIDAMAKQNVFIGRIWPVMADLCAHHDWDRARDGAVPGGMAEGDVGSGDGECWRDAERGRTGPAQTESGRDRDARLRGMAAAELSLGLDGAAPRHHTSAVTATWVRYNIYSCRKSLPSLAKHAEPSVKLSARGVARLQARHPWVYRSDVGEPNGVPPGSLVRVHDQRGKFLGTALYSSSSQIAIRMISHGSVADLPALVAERIRAAIAYRKELVSNTDAYRIVFSEA